MLRGRLCRSHLKRGRFSECLACQSRDSWRLIQAGAAHGEPYLPTRVHESRGRCTCSRKMQTERRNQMFALRAQSLETKPQTAVFKRTFFFLSLHILTCTTDGSVVPEEERAAAPPNVLSLCFRYVPFPQKHGAFTFRREAAKDGATKRNLLSLQPKRL